MYFNLPCSGFRMAEMNKQYKTMEEALTLVKQAVQGEREDELFYDYLLSIAPTQEEKNIIASIRDDERKHNRYFREIYSFYTNQSIQTPMNVEFDRPKSYVDGIKKAKFGELSAVERYRDIRAGLPDEYYRDMVFEILTDELKHAHKYDYLLYLSLENRLQSNNSYMFRTAKPSIDENFTKEDAIEIAETLNIDFDIENFNVEQFNLGLNTELNNLREAINDEEQDYDSLVLGNIVLTHLRQTADYYTQPTRFRSYRSGMRYYY